jgi:hypothetical protein
MLAVGVHGSCGDSASNAAVIGDEVIRLIGDRATLTPLDPQDVLSPPTHEHCYRLHQRPLYPFGDGLPVPTVWHGFPNTWTHLAASAVTIGAPWRIRTSFLSATPSIDDFTYLEAGQGRLADLAAEVDHRHPDRVRIIERALASYQHFASRLTGPLWIGELAITSTTPLTWAHQQILAGTITSAPNLHWADDRAHLLDNGPLRGGYGIEQLPPAELTAAHQRGLPLHGGLRTRTALDLFSVNGLLWDAPPPIPSPALRRVPPCVADHPDVLPLEFPEPPARTAPRP